MTQWQLIRSRRFVPLFWTQFLNAFNDNVYKNALVILIIFQGDTLYGIDTNILVTLCAGFFILPYFLFSATAGQLADKYEKSRLMQHQIGRNFYHGCGGHRILYQQHHLIDNSAFYARYASCHV